MVKLAIQHIPNEIGTSLVGSYSDDGHRAVIHGIAPLSPDSSGSPTSFIRGILGLRDFFDRLLARFRRKRHYVGEWHSHPNGPPAASPKDDRDQKAIAHDEKTDCFECILVIVGDDLSASPSLGVYIYSRTRGKIPLNSM
jgi:hypothetical protein